MTNTDIDKIISLLDKKSLEEVKDYLIKEKERNIRKARQDAFDKYLTTNKFGYDIGRIPKIYISDNEQKFTNGVSLYIINKNFFKTNTSKLTSVGRKTHYSHRFEYISQDKIQKYFDSIIRYYGLLECSCEFSTEDKFVLASFHNPITNNKETRKFDKYEIDMVNIILDNPVFKISESNLVLKAESDIGKVYILGFGPHKDIN